VSPVKYELGFYIPEDDILHSHCSENLKSYRLLLGVLYGCQIFLSPPRLHNGAGHISQLE
jgi:hypothetical protein